MNNPLMECGHAAQDVDIKTNKPCCVICIGINPEAEKVRQVLPDLTGRKAKCSYGCREVDSSFNLAFFEYRPNDSVDRYYCGCYGWD